MSDQKITFGKYAGYSYHQLLERDIQYCKFIDTCPANAKTQDFKEFLTNNLAKYIHDLDQKALKLKLDKLL